MAFHFVRPAIRTKDLFSCLRKTLQTQSAIHIPRQNLTFSNKNLFSSQQRCFATFSKSQNKLRLVFGETVKSGSVLTIRSCGPNKILVRFSSEGSKSSKGSLTSALYIASFGIFMLGMAYLGIPLYRMFCQVSTYILNRAQPRALRQGEV